MGAPFEDEYRPLAREREGYLPLGLVEEGMVDLYKMARIVLSRAGAGTVCELMALGKRSIFVPLAIAQKNEQYHNALAARERLGSRIVEEEDFSSQDLGDLLESFEAESGQSEGALAGSVMDGREFLLEKIEESLKI